MERNADTPVRLLLVDDEEQFVLNLERLLRYRGFDVSTAFSGQAAVDLVESRKRFDVVVLDVMMPDLDGIATLKRVKGISSSTEVVMLTGHATLDSGIQAIRSGAYDYLMKPCEIEDLVEKIREANEVKNIKHHPVLWQRNLVKEIMATSFATLRSGDPVNQALDLLERKTGMAVPDALYVLDHEDRLLGAVTKQDLIRAAQDNNPEHSLSWTDLIQNPEWLPRQTLGETLLPGRTITAEPDDDLTQLAHRMMTHKLLHMPVVQNEKAIGIIRLNDILRHIDHEIE